MNRLVVALVLVFAVGCRREEIEALVNCEVQEGPVVACAIKQTKGTAKMDVCWDFAVTCANGATLEVTHTCQTLRDGGARNVTVPADQVKVSGPCEGAANGQVFNMTINGKVPDRH